MIECIIQARMGSSRLPGKTLMKLDETKTTLDFVINQLSFSKLIDRIVIATTSLDEDNVIEKKAKQLDIDCFRGSKIDVLDRYYRCAKQFEMKTIVRITADCPIIDPIIVDKVIEQFQSGDYDYAANIIFRTYPVGTDTESTCGIKTFDLFDRLRQLIKDYECKNCKIVYYPYETRYPHSGTGVFVEF